MNEWTHIQVCVCVWANWDFNFLPLKILFRKALGGKMNWHKQFDKSTHKLGNDLHHGFTMFVNIHKYKVGCEAFPIRARNLNAREMFNIDGEIGHAIHMYMMCCDRIAY